MKALHHVAIAVDEIDEGVEWYADRFGGAIVHQDQTWALLQFENVELALVMRGQHPPHVAFTSPDADRLGQLTTHRDGTRSIYIRDPFGNSVEVLDAASV